MKKLGYLGLILLALLAACAPAVEQTPEATPAAGNEQPPAENVLANSEWVLVGYGDAGALTAVLDGSQITLEFSDEGIAGSAGCNSYFGDATVDGTTLSVGMLGRTEMWCENRMEQEDAYLELLQGAQSWQLENDELRITAESGVLVYQRPVAQPDAALTGSLWQLETIVQGDAAQSVIAGTQLTIEFNEQGGVSGEAGCNGFGGNYALDGDALHFDGIMHTMMACVDQSIMDQETLYLEMLQNVSSWQIDGNELRLNAESGALVYRPAETAEAPAAELSGSLWQLESIIQGEAVQSVLAGTRVTLEFGADGNATGNTGCNFYGGSYQVDGDTLILGDSMQTLIGCREDIMAQENAYLAALAATETFELTGETLTLNNPEGALVFGLPEHAALEGTTWHLSGMLEGEAMMSTWVDTDITAVFADGQVNGSAGCNEYSATATWDATSLQVEEPVATTFQLCVEERSERETLFLAKLAEVVAYEIKFDTLALLDANGATLLSFSSRQETVEPVITLERTPCFGTCPVYRLEITADGLVTFEGARFVATSGVQYGTISPEAVADLLDAFESTGYLGWEDEYKTQFVTDMPTVITSVTIDGVTKRIEHYHGDQNAPEALDALEDLVDETVNVRQWTETAVDGPVSLPWPNPAFEYCHDQGGYYEEHTDDEGGVYGVCQTADGESCAAWAYLNGVCQDPAGAADVVDSTVYVSHFALDPSSNQMQVQGYYPDGCTQISGITLEMVEQELRVDLHGARPAGMMCTEALEPFAVEFGLQGVLLEPGTELTIAVNDLSVPVRATLGGLEKTVTVAAEKGACESSGEANCLMVREAPEADWVSLDGQIEGFEWEPGYQVEMRVLEQYLPGASPDEPAVRWTLLEVLDKQAK